MELSRGDVGANGFVGRKKQRSNHEICLQNGRKLKFWALKINYFEENIDII
jgi:hypothetical protein